MGTYRPLYSLRVEHDYYDNLACRALAFRLKAGGVDLCRRRGLLFRQTAVNEFRQEIPAIRAIFPNAVIRWHAIYTLPDNVSLAELDDNMQLVANFGGFQSEDLCVQTLMEYYASHPNQNTTRGLNTLLANVNPTSMPGQ